MKRDSQAATSESSPAERLAGFIAKFDPAIGELVEAAWAKLRKRLPSAMELVYDNYNALAIGYGPTERASDVVASPAVYPRWVNLYFLPGAKLATRENSSRALAGRDDTSPSGAPRTSTARRSAPCSTPPCTVDGPDADGGKRPDGEQVRGGEATTAALPAGRSRLPAAPQQRQDDPPMNPRRVTIVLVIAVVLIAGAVALLRRPLHAPPLVVEEWISVPPQTAGKLVMLEFWATTCGPCVAAIPEGNRLQERFRDDLVVIAISDEPAEVVRHHERPPITYASAVDTQARMARALDVQAIPATFIIDPQGIIRWSGDPFLHHNHLRNQQMWDELMTDLIARYGSKRELSAARGS